MHHASNRVVGRLCCAGRGPSAPSRGRGDPAASTGQTAHTDGDVNSLPGQQPGPPARRLLLPAAACAAGRPATAARRPHQHAAGLTLQASRPRPGAQRCREQPAAQHRDRASRHQPAAHGWCSPCCHRRRRQQQLAQYERAGLTAAGAAGTPGLGSQARLRHPVRRAWRAGPRQLRGGMRGRAQAQRGALRGQTRKQAAARLPPGGHRAGGGPL